MPYTLRNRVYSSLFVSGLLGVSCRDQAPNLIVGTFIPVCSRAHWEPWPLVSDAN